MIFTNKIHTFATIRCKTPKKHSTLPPQPSPKLGGKMCDFVQKLGGKCVTLCKN